MVYRLVIGFQGNPNLRLQAFTGASRRVPTLASLGSTVGAISKESSGIGTKALRRLVPHLRLRPTLTACPTRTRTG